MTDKLTKPKIGPRNPAMPSVKIAGGIQAQLSASLRDDHRSLQPCFRSRRPERLALPCLVDQRHGARFIPPPESQAARSTRADERGQAPRRSRRYRACAHVRANRSPDGLGEPRKQRPDQVRELVTCCRPGTCAAQGWNRRPRLLADFESDDAGEGRFPSMRRRLKEVRRMASERSGWGLGLASGICGRDPFARPIARMATGWVMVARRAWTSRLVRRKRRGK